MRGRISSGDRSADDPTELRALGQACSAAGGCEAAQSRLVLVRCAVRAVVHASLLPSFTASPHASSVVAAPLFPRVPAPTEPAACTGERRAVRAEPH